MNNDERELWIDNDEALYLMWKRSKLSKKEFIKENKEMIDKYIEKVISGWKRD